MRKLSIVLTVAVLATIGFSSCGDSSKSLKGTSWKSEERSYSGGKEYELYSFTTGTKCKLDFCANGKVLETLKGTYTYKHPNLTVDFGFDTAYTGIVDGNKMTLTHEGGYTFTVTKQ